MMQTIVADAVKALEGVKGEARDAMTEGLLSRVRYILVDEYQDINADQYRMIALLARKDEPEAEREVRLLAVGDDDQNIYAWNGSDVRFIRQFEADYHPAVHRLLTNYRSSEPIVSFCERFIASLPGRMKAESRLVSAQQSRLTPENARQPIVVRVPSPAHLDRAILGEVERWRREGFADEEIAILAYHNADLYRLQARLAYEGIGVHFIKRLELNLSRIREIHRLLEHLETLPDEELSLGQFRAMVAEGRPATPPGGDNPWEEAIDLLLADYLEETRHPSPLDFRNFIYDTGRDLRMGELRRPGRVTLATMHAAKGLEFPAVIVVPEGLPADPEGRRVTYVAMTRAQKALSVVGFPQPGTIFGEICRREPAVDFAGEPIPPADDMRVWELGLRDVHLSFAGRAANHAQIARVVEGLAPGRRGHLIGAGIQVDGVEVCRLSQAAQSKLASEFAGWQVSEAVCYAIVIRFRQDEATTMPQDGLVRERWEIPLFRLVFRKAVGRS